MSSFRALIERVRVETLSRSRGPFEEAKRHQPALAPHSTLSALLTTMGDEREATYPEREAITRALMGEHRRTGDGRWASVLVLAYYPMLSRLRHRLVSSSVGRDELDQIVLTSFVTSVAEVPLELDRMPMRLRQRTERQVFGFLRKEWAEYHPGAEPDQLAIYGTESIVQRRFEEGGACEDGRALQVAPRHSLGLRSIELKLARSLRRDETGLGRGKSGEIAEASKHASLGLCALRYDGWRPLVQLIGLLLREEAAVPIRVPWIFRPLVSAQHVYEEGPPVVAACRCNVEAG